MKPLSTSLAVLIAFSAATTSVPAKDHKKNDQKHTVAKMMKMHDENGDGKITHAEMLSKRMGKFNALDTNKDGFISLDELPKDRKALMKAVGGRKHVSGSGGMHREMRKEVFIIKDKDGKVTTHTSSGPSSGHGMNMETEVEVHVEKSKSKRKEDKKKRKKDKKKMHEQHEVIIHKGGKGMMSKHGGMKKMAMHGGMGKMSRMKVMVHLDRNADELISKDEFNHVAIKMFKKHDYNGNGVISKKEVKKYMKKMKRKMKTKMKWKQKEDK